VGPGAEHRTLRSLIEEGLRWAFLAAEEKRAERFVLREDLRPGAGVVRPGVTER
jgi:hypothetical protein